MVITTVMVYVKKEFIQDFIDASRENHVNSIKEAGNRRFDVIQSTEDSCRFLLYEAYETQDDAAAHKKTAHYEKWRDTVAPWMAEPRKGVPYVSICP